MKYAFHMNRFVLLLVKKESESARVKDKGKYERTKMDQGVNLFLFGTLRNHGRL